MKRRIINLVINLFVMHFVNKLLIEMCLSGCLMTKTLVFLQMQITTWRWQLFRHPHLISSNNSPYLRSWNCFLKNWQFYFTKSSIFIALRAASPFAGSQSMT